MLLTITLPPSCNFQTSKHTYPLLAGMLLTKHDPRSETTRLKLTCTAPRAIGSSLWTGRRGITALTYRPIGKQIWLDLVRTPPLPSLPVAAMYHSTVMRGQDCGALDVACSGALRLDIYVERRKTSRLDRWYTRNLWWCLG